MSTIAEINNFIIKNADAKYFAADVRLYKKHFPNNAKFIAELEVAPDFAKKALDERILSELLTNQDSCIDCIWENRGFIRDEKGKVVPMKTEPKKATAKTEPGSPTDFEIIRDNLLNVDLQKAKYNVLKQFVFDLGLQAKCENQKKVTYLKVLKDYQDGIQVDTSAEVNTELKKKEAPE